MHNSHILARFSDSDLYGHVNHAVYVDYLQEARLQAMANSGVDANDLATEGLYAVTVELRIRYQRPAPPGQQLAVDSWITEIGATSAWWQQEIRSDAGRVVSAAARCAVIDDRGRVSRIPETVAESLRELETPTT